MHVYFDFSFINSIRKYPKIIYIWIARFVTHAIVASPRESSVVIVWTFVHAIYFLCHSCKLHATVLLVFLLVGLSRIRVRHTFFHHITDILLTAAIYPPAGLTLLFKCLWLELGNPKLLNIHPAFLSRRTIMNKHASCISLPVSCVWWRSG